MALLCKLFNICKRDDGDYNNIYKNEKEYKKQHKKVEEFYDSILKIDKIKDIKEGWEINSKKNCIFNNNFVKIGVIGETKKGKTYILQKLINQNIDKDNIIKTEGLSIKYPNEDDIKNNRNYILIDTTGIEKPILNNEKKKIYLNKIELNEIEELTKEKLLIELFFQQFIIKYSDIPLMIVNELTFSEQKLLTKIQKILRNQKGPKKMFVIHNLLNYYNIQEVKEYIENVLLNLIGINLKKRNNINPIINENNEQKNDIYYEQIFDDKNITYSIIHLITANEFSEAGNYYNTFTIDFLKQNLNQFTNLSSFSLKDKIIENFIEFSKLILKEQADENQFEINDDYSRTIIKYNGKINYKNNLDYQLEIFNLYDNIFVPQFSYYTYNGQFIVELEVSGKTSDIECNCKLENGFYFFYFSGKKIDNKDNLEIHNFYTSIKNELFKLNFVVSADKIILNSNEYDFEDLGNGILSFKFELYIKKKNKKIYE